MSTFWSIWISVIVLGTIFWLLVAALGHPQEPDYR